MRGVNVPVMVSGLAKMPETVQQECASEPIHVPGAIQPQGALLIVRASDAVIVQASVNLCSIFGLEAEAVLGRTAVSVLGGPGWRGVLGSLAADLPNHAGPSLRAPTQGADAVCAIVIVTASRSPCGRICVELEPVEDERNIVQPGGSSGQVTRVQAMIAAVRGARSTLDLCQVAVSELRKVSGFDRAMAYRFGPEGEGQVVAESRSPGLTPYLGLHYPAADIPAQARRLYLMQRVRVIGDTLYTPVPMAVLAGSGPGVDMTFCAFRSVSPIHVEYLGNMGVRASIAISLTGPDGGLWGMLICHDAGPHPVSAEMRSLVDLMGQVVSVLLASIIEAEAMAARLSREQHLREIAGALSNTDRRIADALSDVSAHLLSATASAGAVARVDGRLMRFGSVPADEVALRTIELLRAPIGSTSSAVDELGPLLHDIPLEPGTAAGALVLALPHGADDAIAWFRPEIAAVIEWGGNPHALPERNDDSGRLSPRQSFSAWKDEVRGRCARWTDADLMAASEVRRIMGDAFIRRVEAEMTLLRDRDPLTGLPNRRLLQQRLDALVALDASEQGAGERGAALIYVDLDRFKDVNDSLGHAAGDALLTTVGLRLSEHARVGSLVARIGGDEFAILCEGMTLPEGEVAADALRRAIEAPMEVAGRVYHATASIGVAHSEGAGRAGPGLLQAADAAMYAAKREGGNRAARFTEPLMLAAAKRFSLEQDLRAALLGGGAGLALWFQPIVQVSTGRMAGIEALARWQHPDRGMVPPGEFIPAAETAGLMVQLGDWVLETALSQLAGWTRDRRAASQKLDGFPYLAVNVSPRQLSAGGFAARVATGLAARGLPAWLLEVEVTEGVMADHSVLTELRALRQDGVRVMIDDFGTGYSSLSYLRRLPADGVKLDRSFLPGSLDSEEELNRGADPEADEAFMATVVQLAQRAELEVVAEGMETTEQLGVAARAGASRVQGYLIARPMPAAEMALLLALHEAGERPPWSTVTDAVAAHA